MSLSAQIGISLTFQFVPPGFVVSVLLLRAVFGLCGEGVFTTQALIIGKYAKENYEIVLSIAITLPFVFDSLNSVVTTFVYDQTHNLPLGWWIGCCFCLVSLISGIFLSSYMKWIDVSR